MISFKPGYLTKDLLSNTIPLRVRASWAAHTVKNLPAMGRPGFSPGLGRSPREGNDNPLQFSCLENPMDGGAWWATVHGVTKNQTQLSN